MPEDLSISVGGFWSAACGNEFRNFFYFILTCARCGANDFNFAFARRMVLAFEQRIILCMTINGR
jgi:hypothetical protein